MGANQQGTKQVPHHPVRLVPSPPSRSIFLPKIAASSSSGFTDPERVAGADDPSAGTVALPKVPTGPDVVALSGVAKGEMAEEISSSRSCLAFVLYSRRRATQLVVESLPIPQRMTPMRVPREK